MRGRFKGVALAAGLTVAALMAQGASAEALRLSGTGGAMPMMQQVAAAYADAGGPEIEIIVGLGSGGAIRATADGAIDLAVSSRELTPEEAAAGLRAAGFARTPLVLVTSRAEPPGLASAELAGIFAATSPKWPDGTPISLILRTASDTDAQLLEAYFPGMEQALAAARLRPELPVTSTDQDNAALAEQLPGSLVQAGLSQIVSERRDLRAVALDGVEPTLANLHSGAYPYEKRFYLVYTENSAAAARGLLAFMHSGAGQGVLRASAALPVAE